MIWRTFDEQVKAFEKIREKLSRGAISVERLDDAVKRVLEMKENIGLFEDLFIVDAEVGSEESRKIAERIVRNSITVCRDFDGIIQKIPSESLLIVCPSSTNLVKIEEGKSQRNSEMVQVFKQMSKFDVKSVLVSPKPTKTEIERVVSEIRNFKGTTLLCTLNAHIVKEMQALVNRVMGKYARSTLLVALRNPYDGFLPNVRNSIALYNYSGLSQRTFAEMIVNREKFIGKLPLFHWRG